MTDEEMDSLEERLLLKSNDATAKSQLSQLYARQEEEAKIKEAAMWPIEEYVTRVMLNLKKPPPKAIYSVLSEFNDVFTFYYHLNDEEAVAAIKMLEMDGKILTELLTHQYKLDDKEAAAAIKMLEKIITKPVNFGFTSSLPEDAATPDERRDVYKARNEQGLREATVVGRVEAIERLGRTTYLAKIRDSADGGEYCVLPNRLGLELFDVLHQEVKVTGFIIEADDRKLLWPKNYGVRVDALRSD